MLDEPTNHLDIRHQIELLTLLRAQRCTPEPCSHPADRVTSSRPS
ncbi:hypothetical protein [Streptomyces sp. NPDC097640]